MMNKIFIFIFIVFSVSTAFSSEKIIGPTSGSGRWIKIARIQNQNPIGSSERAQFSGTLNAQTWFGNTGDIQYSATFSFGSRGTIKPLLFEVGDAAKIPNRIEWRIFKDTEGYHYLWIWQSAYSGYLKFDFQNSYGIEYWTFENPPSDYSLVWSSVDGVRQSINNANFSGNVGIGTKSPAEKLDVYGKISAKESFELRRGTDNSKKIADITWYAPNNGLVYSNNNGGYHTFKNNLSGDMMRITPNGYVGIGTINPDSKLAVNGNIHTKEVKVDLIGWSDFVFENDYNLPSLKEVENHIKEKGHLKDIPSALDVGKNGIYLGEMNSKLLQKIEELTLYTIQQQKEIQEQKAIVEKQTEEIEFLKSLAKRLTKVKKKLKIEVEKNGL